VDLNQGATIEAVCRKQEIASRRIIAGGIFRRDESAGDGTADGTEKEKRGGLKKIVGNRHGHRTR